MKFKRLLMASALALSFVVSTPSVAKADPISAAVVTFIGFTGTAATVATFVINSALYAAGSWAVGKAAQALGLVKSAVSERQASVTSLSLGEVPRELIVGTACTGGSLADAFNFGGKYGTDTVTRGILLADHELDAMVGYYVDDQYYPWVASGVQPGFNGKLSIDFRNARADGWAPPQHVMQNGGWTDADRLVGIAHVWIDTRVDDQIWTQGHPRFRFVVRGLKAYDPRKDAALGYTGPNPHVWENPETHEFSRNAEVLRYNYQRGVYAAGRHGQPEHLLFGRGLSAEEAPPHRVIAAANLCDEQVDGEARYCADGVISAAQTFIEVEEMFAAAMAGVIVQREGGVEVEPGHAKAAVFTITDDDLVEGEPVSFTEFLPDTEGGRINTVFSRYVEPTQGWKDHGGPPRRVHADIVEDGGPREMTLPLMLVTSGKQADRCAEIARRRGRLERRASIVLPPEFAEIEEGDWIAWRSARRHGGATVRYQVTSYSLDAKWRNRLSLEEIASSVYGVPDPIEDQAEPPAPPVPVDALQLLGVTAEAITLAGPLSGSEEGDEPLATSTVPAVRFKWDVTEQIDAAVRAIRAEVRIQGTDDVTPTRTEDVALGVLVTTNGVGPKQTLEVRLVPIGEAWRPVLPSPWLVVTTGSLIADGVTRDAAQELIDEATKEIDDKVKGGLDQFEKAADLAGLFKGQEDLSEAVLKLGRGQTELQGLVETHTRDGGKLVKSIVRVIGGELENAQGAIVEEASLSLQRDLAEALLRQALALQVDDNRVSGENALSAVVTDLSAEVTARTALGIRLGLAEGAITDEATVRGNQDQVFVQNFGLLGARRGNQSGFILNKETVDLNGEGSFASILSGLRATDGANSSSIVNLQSASGSQASQLTTLSNTVGGQTLSISQLLSVTQGLGARYTLSLDGDGAATQMIADGQTRAIVFKAASLTITDNGAGLSYQPATGRLSITRGGMRTVLGAGGSLILWSGPTSISAGSELVDNGVLGISNDDAWFGGATANGPFTTGSGSGQIALPKNTWTTVASVAARRLQDEGDLFAQLQFEVTVSGAPDGINDYGVQYRIAVANPDGSGATSVVGNFGGFPTNVWTAVNVYLRGHVSTARGPKRLLLQINPSGSTITTASARNARMDGQYAGASIF